MKLWIEVHRMVTSGAGSSVRVYTVPVVPVTSQANCRNIVEMPQTLTVNGRLHLWKGLVAGELKDTTLSSDN